MSNLKSIGRRVAKLRKEAGLTQAAAAEAIGIGRSYLGEIEGGTCRGGIEAMIAIADYFKVPFDWLLCRKPPVGGPLTGHFVDDVDELAWVDFWRKLDDIERNTALKMLGISRVRLTGR